MTQHTDISPIERLHQWLEDAKNTPSITEPTAMALATASADGEPSVRIVLLKELTNNGASFFTNNESTKGQQLSINPKASLCFYWMPLKRQVRLSGPVTPVRDQEADEYFASRCHSSQLGAWASQQSRPLESREKLLERFEEATQRYGDGNVPRPAYWSGWRLNPRQIEFWQEGEFRLHERELYRKQSSGKWTSELLNP